jgi:hypothetical protein
MFLWSKMRLRCKESLLTVLRNFRSLNLLKHFLSSSEIARKVCALWILTEIFGVFITHK